MHNAKKIGSIIIVLQTIILFAMDKQLIITDDFLYHTLLESISNKDEKLFKGIILKHPKILNYTSIDQLPPLHYILHYCGLKHHALSSEYLRTALKAGADPNIIDRNGHTPLHIASTREHVDLLLDFKADPNIKDNFGRTPFLDHIFKSSFRKINPQETIRKIDPLIISLYLATDDIKASDYAGINSLYMAIATKNIPLIELLLRRKVPINPLFVCGQKISYMTEYKNPSEMIRSIAELRALLEPLFQKYLVTMLCKNDKDKVAEFMENYSWIDYPKIDKKPFLVCIKEKCRSIGTGRLFHTVHTFQEYLNKALLKADLQETERLIKTGARINIATQKDAHKTEVLFESLITGNHAKATLLLQHGALVTRFILDDPIINKDLQDLLQEKYDEQTCIICWQHPENMQDIPCINKHPDYFICKICYDRIVAGNNQCPLHCGTLGEYDTEFGKYRRKRKPNPQ